MTNYYERYGLEHPSTLQHAYKEFNKTEKKRLKKQAQRTIWDSLQNFFDLFVCSNIGIPREY